jgi:hypothetical protein
MRELVGIGGVVAALSVASDLTRGHPPGEAMRACLLATELARRAGLDQIQRGEVYYGTLLRFAGCAATSHEIAASFGGDDIIVRARGDLIDPTVPAEAMQFLAGLGIGAQRLRILGGAEGVARMKARTGKPGVASFFRDLAESIEITEFAPHSLAAGDDDVHLLVRWTFRSITTGREASMTMHHYWRVRDGKIEHFRGSEDTEQTALTLTRALTPAPNS